MHIHIDNDTHQNNIFAREIGFSIIYIYIYITIAQYAPTNTLYHYLHTFTDNFIYTHVHIFTDALQDSYDCTMTRFIRLYLLNFFICHQYIHELRPLWAMLCAAVIRPSDTKSSERIQNHECFQAYFSKASGIFSIRATSCSDTLQAPRCR